MAKKRVMVIGGGRLSCEDGYLLQALAREVLKTPHVDTAPVGGAEALVDGMWEVFDQPRSTIGFDGLRKADLAVVLGCDPSRSHPLVKESHLQRHRLAPIVLIPVRNDLDRTVRTQ